jgi:hypothetical protein
MKLKAKTAHNASKKVAARLRSKNACHSERSEESLTSFCNAEREITLAVRDTSEAQTNNRDSSLRRLRSE